jgi:SAM-dependent methyltransferase
MPGVRVLGAVDYAQQQGPVRGIPRRCPVCDGSEALTIFENRMAACAGYDFSAPILLCASCGSGYAGTALPTDDLNDYYSNLSKYDTLSSASDISSLDRERAALATAFVGPLVNSIGSALDVGCSTGVFLSRLRDAGIRDVRGIDPAIQAADVARDLFGIQVSRASAEGFDGYGRFDLVCLMAVLEHLLEPRRLLGEVAQQLKPGARVLIEVPDAGAFDRPFTNDAFEPLGEFSNEHINFFAIGNLRRLAHDVGLEVERWQSFRANGSPGLFALLHRSECDPELITPEKGSAPTRVSCGESLLPYVSRSLFLLEDVEERLARVCGSDVLVYGAGNHTCRLMIGSAALSNCMVRAVFDRNSHLHGLKIGSATILPPSKIEQFPGLPIIVSTFNASRDIQTTLRGLTSQPVIALYH